MASPRVAAAYEARTAERGWLTFDFRVEVDLSRSLDGVQFRSALAVH